MSSWKPMFLLASTIVVIGVFMPTRQQEGGAMYYRSPMHPWVTSDRPGRCTVCGMELVPVFRPSGAAITSNWLTGDIYSGYSLTNATARKLMRTVRVSGRIVPNHSKTRYLAAEVDGRIEKVFVASEGIEVIQGEPLYSIYSPEIREAERDFHLLYQQSQMSHSSKITAEHSRLLKAMRLRLRQYGLTPQQITDLPKKPDNISTTDILSPMPGLVSVLQVSDGDRVKAGQKLMQIDDLYHLWFEFDVYESDLPAAVIGREITIETSGKSLISKISFINDLFDSRTRSTTARAELRNPVIRKAGLKTRGLMPGAFAEGRIKFESESELTLPREAFLSDGNGFVVFVRDGNQVIRKQVLVGFQGDQAWEVLRGITATNDVVIQGNLLLESESRL